MRLSFHHSITERRNFGKQIINQDMTVFVEYNPEEDSISDPEVWIYHGGIGLEVSRLLDKAEGNPLNAILDAINWKELYQDRTEAAEL